MQSFGLLTGMLASDLAVDLEPETRTGPSAQATAAAHDRVCPRHPEASRARSRSSVHVCSHRWVRPTRHSDPLGKQVASLAQTFLSNLTAPSGVQPGGRWFPMSGVEKVMGACVWCMRPVFAVVGLVPCESLANGKAVPPRSQSPRERSAPSARRWFHTAPASRDWSRREHRRACQHLVRDQRVEVNLSPSAASRPIPTNVILSCTQRARTRLSWETRLARNA